MVLGYDIYFGTSTFCCIGRLPVTIVFSFDVGEHTSTELTDFIMELLLLTCGILLFILLVVHCSHAV